MSDLLYMKCVLHPENFLSRGPVKGYTPSALTKQYVAIDLVSNVSLTPVLAWQYAPDAIGASSFFRYQLLSVADFVAGSYGVWTDVVGPFNALSPATMTRVVSSVIKIIPTGNMLTQNGTCTIAIVPDGVGSSTFVYSKANIDSLKYLHAASALDETFALYMTSTISFQQTPVFTNANTIITGYMISDGVNAVKYAAQITSVVEYIPSAANTSLVPQDYATADIAVMTSLSRHLQSGYISKASIIGNFNTRPMLDFQVGRKAQPQKQQKKQRGNKPLKSKTRTNKKVFQKKT